MRDYLFGLFGADGAAATALVTLGTPLSGTLTEGSAYTVVIGDRGRLIDCSGTWTLSLLAAGTAGNGFTIGVKNSGNGLITVDPNLSETIDGGATLAINSGESTLVYCNGSAWLSVGRSNGVPSGFFGPYGGGTVPAGWLLCDGSAISRTAYASLFSAIGTVYGVGDGTSTFNVPDLRGRVIAGRDDMGGTAAGRLTSTVMTPDGNTAGATGGAQTHVLTTAQMPSHTHSVDAGVDVNGIALPWVNDVVPDYHGASVGLTSSAAGSGTAHDNTQPTLIANWIIKA